MYRILMQNLKLGKSSSISFSGKYTIHWILTVLSVNNNDHQCTFTQIRATRNKWHLVYT